MKNFFKLFLILFLILGFSGKVEAADQPPLKKVKTDLDEPSSSNSSVPEVPFSLEEAETLTPSQNPPLSSPSLSSDESSSSGLPAPSIPFSGTLAPPQDPLFSSSTSSPPGSQKKPEKKQEEKDSPSKTYDKVLKGKDEGWRWRDSLNFTYKDFDPREDKIAKFDVDQFHGEMKAHELFIYGQPELKDTSLNVLIPAISIIVETKGSFRIVGDYFDSQYYTPPPVSIGPELPSSSSSASSSRPSKPIVFISGLLSSYQQGIIDSLPNYEFWDESNFGAVTVIKDKLSELLSPTLSGIINRSLGAYKHTEHFLHLFLANKERTARLIAGILEKNGIQKEDKIHEIILHIHSRLDICSVCARSLSWMSSKNISELIIQPLLAKGYQGPSLSGADKGIQFLLLASSRVPYLNDDSRERGLDGLRERQIDAASFPPVFAVRALRDPEG